MKKIIYCVGSALLLAACGALKPAVVAPIAYYSWVAAEPSAKAVRTDANAALQTNETKNNARLLPTIIVNPPQAAAGFQSSKIVFFRQPFRMEYYSQSEWVAPPGRMLTPMLVQALNETGFFKAVVLTPSAAAADLRLITDIVKLQQNFFIGGALSQVSLTVRAHVMDEKTRQVLMFREFNVAVDSQSEDAAGGVMAASIAAQIMLKQLTKMASEVLVLR